MKYINRPKSAAVKDIDIDDIDIDISNGDIGPPLLQT